MTEPQKGVIAVNPGTKFSFVGKLPEGLTITIGGAGEPTKLEFPPEADIAIAIEAPGGSGGRDLPKR